MPSCLASHLICKLYHAIFFCYILHLSTTLLHSTALRVHQAFDTVMENSRVKTRSSEQTITTREKASSSAGFRCISSVGRGATNKALQLTHSSSACSPALLLHKCSSSALNGSSLLLIAIARFSYARYCYYRAAANFCPLATANFSSFLFFSAYLFCI